MAIQGIPKSALLHQSRPHPCSRHLLTPPPSLPLSDFVCASLSLRFHYPVSGKLQRRYLITGEYHTVSPIAVRKNVDVYVENKRVSLGTERGERAVLAAAQLQLCARLSHSHLPFALVFALAFR